MNRLGYDAKRFKISAGAKAAFNQQRQELIDAGFGGLQNQIILDRARMAQQINQLNSTGDRLCGRRLRNSADAELH